MKALKLVERMPDVDVSAEVQSWNGRLQMASLAPNGVEKLRQLILDLAIRGKLVPQNLKDEPAIKFLERVKAKGEQIGISKGRKKKEVIAEFDEPFVLPVGWEWASLSSLASVIRGVTYSKSDASEVPLAGYSPLLRGNNIGKGLNFEKLVFVPKNLIADHQFIRAGDIVIAMSSGSADLVGKAAQANSDFEGGFGAFCGVIRPKIDLLSTYFGFFFQTPYYRTTVARQGKGIGINNLQKTQLELLAVPVPPFGEQQRIAAKVGELMDLCDKLEAQKEDAAAAHEVLVKTLLGTLTQSQTAAEFQDNWRRIAQHFNSLFTTESSIEELKKTILQLAVMGKLVPQDPNDEPAIELLKRIKDEKENNKRLGKIKKSKPLPEIEDSEKPFQLPLGWVWARFEDVTLISGGLALGKKSDITKTVQMPYLRVANVQRGYLKLDTIKEVSVQKAEVEKYRLLPGDLLIVEGGDWDKVGRTAVWRGEIKDCLHQNHVFKARKVIEEFNERWAEFYLNSHIARQYFESVSKQTTNLASINMTELRSCFFPLPPVNEQRRIVDKTDELITICDALKARLVQHSVLHQYLANAIVQKAVG